jgi:sugar phosphate isomerase/epimerase
MNRPRIILSSRASFNRYGDSIRYAREHGYEGIEWYLDYYRLPVWKGTRNMFFRSLRESGLRYSFHAPTSDVELALRDRTYATLAFGYLKMYVDFLSDLAPLTLTIHIGARRIPVEELSWDHAMEYLKRLTEHADSKKITICLENLVAGWTGDPERLMEMVHASGAAITYDVGHARGGEWVRQGRGTALEFLNIIAPKVINAHIYAYENEKGEHEVPDRDTPLSPILKRLSETGCRWWVLELNTYEETEETRRLVKNYLDGY